MIIKARILNIKRGKSSKYGNQKYHFILQNVLNNYYFWGETETNSTCAYTITNHFYDKEVYLRGSCKGDNFIIEEIIESGEKL